MTDELRSTLHRIADDVRPLPVADDLWQRGRAARRRGQALAIAAVLALIVSVGGFAMLALGGDKEAHVADSEAPGGAIPSRIEDPGTDRLGETGLAIGRGSVAFISRTGMPVVIGATDGRYHYLGVDAPLALALSPDGRRLAWAISDRLHVADLETGDVLEFAHNAGKGAYVTTMFWLSDSTNLVWRAGRENGQEVAGMLDVSGPSEMPVGGHAEFSGPVSPGRDMTAVASDGVVSAAPFLQEGGGRGGGQGIESIDRALPADLYPDGAALRPLGWAAEDLVLAEMDAPAGSYVEGRHLVLFTSPDRPESEWTYRIVMRDVPEALSLTIAVDLIPDLDGTSSQVLTHDFGQDTDGGSPWRDRLPGALGGLMALLAGLAYIRMLHKQA